MELFLYHVKQWNSHDTYIVSIIIASIDNHSSYQHRLGVTIWHPIGFILLCVERQHHLFIVSNNRSIFQNPVLSLSAPQVQPVDAMLLSSLKCRNDSYHSILTTSPLLYLNHPLTVSPLRPLTLTLPCPPNPKKMKTGEEKSCTYSGSTALMPDTISAYRVR